MKLSLFMFTLSLCLFINIGCSQKQSPPIQDQQAISMSDDASKKTSETKSDIDRDRMPQETISERQHQRAQQEDFKIALRELQTKVKDIYFGFDSYNIEESAKVMLKQVSEILSNNRKVKVIIEGHCDERGTREYNLGLGERRANAVKEYLISLGIPSKRIDTISYGKEKPQCSEKSEACWAKNRRAHFVFLEDTE